MPYALRVVLVEIREEHVGVCTLGHIERVRTRQQQRIWEDGKPGDPYARAAVRRGTGNGRIPGV
jgi:hypothetical protein